MASLPPVFIEFLGRNDGVKRALSDIKRESRKTAEEGETSFGKFGRLGTAAIAGIGLAAAGAAVGAVKMAADFQSQMLLVQTSGGEAASKMKYVSDAVLAMAGQVGQSTSSLAAGLKTIEAAGYHAKDGIDVLRVAAEGAKVGGADLATVSDALTTAMNAYHMGAGQATQAMNALIATDASGKTSLESLSGAMSQILPVSAAAKVGMNEVLGAMATMTAQGTSADVAATYLRQTIGQLANASPKAAATMQGLGLSALDVQKNLGKNGLISTLNMLTDAIEKKMGPDGTVMIDTLKKAASSGKDFQSALQKMTPTQKTYIGALATMVGGTKSMMGALQLTGPHMQTFKDNVKGIGDHVRKGGKEVEGWADVQKTFNQKMAEAKASLQAMTIQIGQALLPVATRIMGVIAHIVTWLTRHKTVAEGLAVVIGTVLVAAIVGATMAMYAWITSAEVLEALPMVAAITAIIIIILLLVTHWKQVWGVIKSVALAVGHAVADAWHWVAQKTSALWHDISKAVTDAWNSVASFFSSAWHTVADPIVSAWHWITNTTTAVWNGIVAFFKRWWPLLLVIFLPFVALIIAIWNHFHKQIIGTAMSVWRAVSSFFVGAWHGIEKLALLLFKQVYNNVVKPMQQAWHFIRAVWDVIKPYLLSAWHWIAGQANAAWQAVKRYIIQPIEDAWHWLVGKFNAIKNYVGQKLGEAVHSVQDIAKGFYHVGVDIVMGIVHGVENAGGALFDSLKNLAGNALDAAKSFLGINSPSRVFADHVGMAIPEGIAKGVIDHGHLAHRAVGALAGALSAQKVSLGTAMPAYAGGYGAAGYGGAQVAEITVIAQVDKDTLFKVQQRSTLQYNRRNLTNGQSLARG